MAIEERTAAWIKVRANDAGGSGPAKRTVPFETGVLLGTRDLLPKPAPVCKRISPAVIVA